MREKIGTWHEGWNFDKVKTPLQKGYTLSFCLGLPSVVGLLMGHYAWKAC